MIFSVVVFEGEWWLGITPRASHMLVSVPAIFFFFKCVLYDKHFSVPLINHIKSRRKNSFPQGPTFHLRRLGSMQHKHGEVNHMLDGGLCY